MRLTEGQRRAIERFREALGRYPEVLGRVEFQWFWSGPESWWQKNYQFFQSRGSARAKREREERSIREAEAERLRRADAPARVVATALLTPADLKHRYRRRLARPAAESDVLNLAARATFSSEDERVQYIAKLMEAYDAE